MTGAIRVARVYDDRGDAGDDDGAGAAVHALVDRLWPRGVRKEDPRIDVWWKELAPTSDLRTWYGHDPDKFEEFSGRYEQELDAPAMQQHLREAADVAKESGLVLLTATKDLAITHARVLAAVVEQIIEDDSTSGGAAGDVR